MIDKFVEKDCLVCGCSSVKGFRAFSNSFHSSVIKAQPVPLNFTNFKKGNFKIIVFFIYTLLLIWEVHKCSIHLFVTSQNSPSANLIFPSQAAFSHSLLSCKYLQASNVKPIKHNNSIPSLIQRFFNGKIIELYIQVLTSQFSICD